MKKENNNPQPTEAKHSLRIPKKPILFWFLFLFILSFIISYNNSTFPFLTWVNRTFLQLFTWLMRFDWIKSIFHDAGDIELVGRGSGDHLYFWFIIEFVFLLSLLGTVIYWLIPRKNRSNQEARLAKANSLLHTMIRYYVGLMLINYGLIKLFKTQFPFPNILTLNTKLGDLSPMGLTWAFFGYSYSYNIFVGIVEIMAILLLFRRTTTLGALISFAASVNIMMINYSYDVSVKILSTALALLTFYLLLPQLKNFYDFLVLQKKSQLSPSPSLFTYIKSKKIRTALQVLKYLLIVGTISMNIYTIMNTKKLYVNIFDENTPLYGYYHIDNDQAAIRESMNMPSYWEAFIFMSDQYFMIKYENGKSEQYEKILDTKKQLLKIISKSGEKGFEFKYSVAPNGDLLLSEQSGKSQRTIRLTAMPAEKSTLKSHQTQWIRKH